MCFHTHLLFSHHHGNLTRAVTSFADRHQASSLECYPFATKDFVAYSRLLSCNMPVRHCRGLYHVAVDCDGFPSLPGWELENRVKKTGVQIDLAKANAIALTTEPLRSSRCTVANLNLMSVTRTALRISVTCISIYSGSGGSSAKK